jgi:hypothetical protein
MSLKDVIAKATSIKTTPKSFLAKDGSDVEVNSIKLESSPFNDGAGSIDEREFEVSSQPQFPGFGDDLNGSTEFNGSDSVLRAVGSQDGADPIGLDDLVRASRGGRARADLFSPIRDSFSPTLNSLSTIGIDKLGGYDEARMRAVLKKVLRSIRV